MKASIDIPAAKLLHSCPTLRPHRQQHTRLLRPWDSPGKNTGVGCHFLLQCMKGKVKVKSLSRVQLFRIHGLQPTRLLRPWDFPDKSTGVGCHCLLRSIDIKRGQEWFYSKESLHSPVTEGRLSDAAHLPVAGTGEPAGLSSQASTGCQCCLTH